MTTFWKSHCHFASNVVDLAEFWALYQKIIAPEVEPPSKKCFDQLNNHLNYHKNMLALSSKKPVTKQMLLVALDK
jgi:hypothetical protein